MSALQLPDETPAPEPQDETAADADVRDLTNEIVTKLGYNGHQITTERYTGWSRLHITTPQGFVFDVPLIQER